MIGIVIIVLVVLMSLYLLKGLFVIRDDKVGILTRKMGGQAMPQGQIIALKGEVGIQADYLMPGLYWRFPLFWRIEKAPVTKIEANQVGTVYSIDGLPLEEGRIFGDEVKCNGFQDAKMFLENGGRKGPQIAILKPGIHRINTRVFMIETRPATIIPERKIGEIIAEDGIPLPPAYMVAPKPKVDELEDDSRRYTIFESGQVFLNSRGYRGSQEDTLQPGVYYIHPGLFKIILDDVSEIPPGYVAVLRSNIGLDVASESRVEIPSGTDVDPNFKQPIHEKDEVVLAHDINTRGIQAKSVLPGIYNMNKLALTAFLVPTSAITIDWAAEERAEREKHSSRVEEFFQFAELKVMSKDGFGLDVGVKVVIRIKPEFAPYVIARFGTVANLINQIVHPLIDSVFRNNAGEKEALDFVSKREALQTEALEIAKKYFEQYHVEAQKLLIGYIKVPDELLKTQTDKQIALQRKEQYKEQASAEQERIDVESKKAQADMQPSVMTSQLKIDIASNEAEAARKRAAGTRDAAIEEAKGDAFKNREVGKAIADAYQAQAEVIGPQNLANVQIMERVANGNVQIVPHINVSGIEGSGGLGALFATIFSANQAEQLDHSKEIVKKDTPADKDISVEDKITTEESTANE
ncbi:MAG: SPFH domain-containing protein [Candidatus Paceibacterota bacterium]